MDDHRYGTPACKHPRAWVFIDKEGSSFGSQADAGQTLRVYKNLITHMYSWRMDILDDEPVRVPLRMLVTPIRARAIAKAYRARTYHEW